MKYNRLVIKIIILLILFILVLVTSFRSGVKIYKIEEIVKKDTQKNTKGVVARWNFKTKIRVGNEVYYNEDN